MSTTQIQNSHYQSLLSGATNELAGNDQPWLRALRETAAAKFSKTGFPSPRDEEWRYTNVRALEKNQFKLVEKAGSVDASVIQKLLFEGCDYGVFVDGYYQADVSSIAKLPSGVIVAPMSVALNEHADLLQQYLGKIINVNADGESAKRADDKGFSNFNTALFTDGMFVYLPKNTVLEKPLQLLFISSEETELGLSNSRNVVVAEAGAKGHVIETHYGVENQAYLNNVVTEIVVEANANLVHSRLQIESLTAYHIGGVYTSLQENAIFKQENYQFGAALSRVEVHADLGTASAATLNGLYIGQGRQHIDNHTRLNHHMPHAVSKQTYKGILDDKARGVFQGRIIVAEDAQKTDADMGNRNLLLSNRAEVDTKPQLEIYADDVKCAHGVTVGQLDENAIFYLRTRAADEQTARNMLTFAFANDMVEQNDFEPLSLAVLDELLQRFPQQGMRKEWL